jgi:hypothetical protein
MDCKKCGEGLEKFANWDYDGQTITCPNCGHVMGVEFDEGCEADDWNGFFYVVSGPGLIDSLFFKAPDDANKTALPRSGPPGCGSSAAR